ncbi:transcription regulator NrdR [Natrialba magadii ATCC 43099]|uniref:Transcriptional repressor NrdR n=1 Tax=Natrialba magadii (strain ATCC 43099 / DSM 3394 / CCM 3739 / CIP 104546 / IAM 13178 / JCM 8861 / NBRC 102185 / NCIMB 2190 / MS3) TaxID=547559 RepID=D3SZ24_NATMM|nr:transcriptional regulator NrdR [Natrialba magadii]ADD06216.1 transcription regulator NrdR [Natrialba magadii ATCC 43099]ELY31069.1 transcriptional regulator NrdR [Natrialba magadii ATCC 43099]
MNCPDCTHDRTRVIDTEARTGGTAVRRRRECRCCSFRFTTYERPAWDSLQVKKRDGALEPFDRAKLRAGIERAVEKRDVTDTTVTSLIDQVEATLQERETRLVSSNRIGELVSAQLREVDVVAYIRFVSVYKAFSDPEAFRRELDAVLDGTSGVDEGQSPQPTTETDNYHSDTTNP